MIKKVSRLALVRSSAVMASPNQRVGKVEDFDFQGEPGMLYITTRAISSRVNANYDAWPADEIRGSYQSFVGRGVFMDHNNWDTKRTRGVIIDAKLYEGKLSNGHDDVWVELLIEVDAMAFPSLAKDILSGDIDATSMGANIKHSECSVCGNKAKDQHEYCAHIPFMKGQWVEVEDRTAATGKRKVLCYEICRGVDFFENSFVFDPADESAIISDAVLFPMASRRIQKHIRRSGEPLENYRQRVGSSMAKVASRQHRAGYDLLMSMPDEVDTMRDEMPCPNCGEEWNGTHCERCQFEEPLEGLASPIDGEVQGTPGEGSPEEEASESPEEEAKEKEDAKPKSDSKEKKKTDSDKKSSRFDEVMKGGNSMGQEYRRRRAPQRRRGEVYDQSTDQNPGTQTGPYGGGTEGAPAGGPTIVPGLVPDAIDDVQNLDVNPVAGPPGQSAVTVSQRRRRVPAARIRMRRALLQDAAALERRAALLRRQAENVVQQDVRSLDDPAPVETAADATVSLLEPVAQPDQLELAGNPTTVNDGTESGLPVGDLQAPAGDADNPGTQTGPYVGSMTGARYARIANLVDDRIEAGLASRENRAAEFARFEAMSDIELLGYSKAWDELKDFRPQAKRVRVSSRRAGVPAVVGSSERRGGEVRSQGDVYLGFL